VIFGRSNGYLLTEQTAHDVVNGLAEIARDIITAAEGAGVSIIDQDGTRVSVGATDPDVLEADNLQYEFGQGPCMRAWSTGEPVYIADTRIDDRLPLRDRRPLRTRWLFFGMRRCSWRSHAAAFTVASAMVRWARSEMRELS
jgi:hypothetical protein